MTGHLTDSQIQEYLDHSGHVSRKQLLEHVDQCQACSQKLKQYQSLYAGLSLEPATQLPADFASLTAKAAMLQKTKSRLNLSNDVLLIGGLGLVTLGASAFFIDWHAVKGVLENAAQGLQILTNPKNHLLADLIDNMGSSLSLIPVAALALGFIALLDHRLQKRLHNPPGL